MQEIKTTAGVSYTIAYGYDAAGNITQITYPSGRIVTYARDALGRISGVTTQANATAPIVTLASNVTYKPFGPLASLTYGNGLTLTKTYTQDYLLNGLTVQDPSTLATPVNRSHARTDNINLTNITDNADATRSETYGYTPANRLQTAAGLYGSLTWSYDGVGNRTQEVVGSTTNTYNYPSTSNLLTSVTQGSTTVRGFTIDGAGNVITDNRGGPAYTYRYNNRGRLDQVTLGATVTANYAYDGLERMAIRTTQNPAGTTHYLYDRAGWLLAEAGSTGTTVTEYVWLDEMPLAIFANADTGTPSLLFVHADHLDRPVKMTDANKALVWDAIYAPFGAVFSITGSASNNLRFPGQYFLIESGLHYNWHRHYDPTIGRYLQADPLEFVDGPSLYAYVGGNPITRTDPTGLSSSFWKCLGQCAAEHYLLTGATAASAAGATPLYKPWLGLGIFGNASSFTNPISYFGFRFFPQSFTGIQILGSARLFGILGRANLFIGAALLVVDAIVIGKCVDECMSKEDCVNQTGSN